MGTFAKEMVSMALLAVSFAFLFQTTAFATYYIPSESMVPTLQVGDRVTAAKFPYGWSRHSLAFEVQLPKSVMSGRLLRGEPKRGDIVVFIHPKTGDRMIKRLIGLPGDRLAIDNGQVVLNGERTKLRLIRKYRFREYQAGVVEVEEFEETLPGGRPHKILMRTHAQGPRFLSEITVPQEHYFMMGDNRDNSADSRFPHMGFVPGDNLIGRADAIFYSFYSCFNEPGLDCANPRFATLLD